MRQPRHHRIEVDHAAAGPGQVVDQDVVQLGVVVGGPLDDLPGSL
ncbi:hypothetical protein SDC9_163079 [bioreactor metagenome]|uniref:Uncharacterized protein n=1 Tax=bioreactor metagenome TaxID=1076179 RepID=A0A645FUR7_9ZZZZ